MPDRDETKETGPASPGTKAPEVERSLKKDSTLSSSTRLSDDESGEEDEDEDYDDEDGDQEDEDEDEDNTEVCKSRVPLLNKPPSPCPLKTSSSPEVCHMILLSRSSTSFFHNAITH